MDIIVNGEPHSIQEQISVLHLLNVLEMPSPKGIAIAINDVVVPRTEWANRSIESNDQITIIKATQGG